MYRARVKCPVLTVEFPTCVKQRFTKLENFTAQVRTLTRKLQYVFVRPYSCHVVSVVLGPLCASHHFSTGYTWVCFYALFNHGVLFYSPRQAAAFGSITLISPSGYPWYCTTKSHEYATKASADDWLMMHHVIHMGAIGKDTAEHDVPNQQST